MSMITGPVDARGMTPAIKHYVERHYNSSQVWLSDRKFVVSVSQEMLENFRNNAADLYANPVTLQNYDFTSHAHYSDCVNNGRLVEITIDENENLKSVAMASKALDGRTILQVTGCAISNLRTFNEIKKNIKVDGAFDLLESADQPVPLRLLSDEEYIALAHELDHVEDHLIQIAQAEAYELAQKQRQQQGKRKKNESGGCTLV